VQGRARISAHALAPVRGLESQRACIKGLRGLEGLQQGVALRNIFSSDYDILLAPARYSFLSYPPVRVVPHNKSSK